MIICPKCQNPLQDGSKFCDKCGTSIPAPVFCAHCGTPVPAGSAFCAACGTAVQNSAPAPSPKAPTQGKPKLTKQMRALIIAGMALVLVAAILLPLVLGGGDAASFGLYLKDGQLSYIDLDDDITLQFTDRLNDSGESMDVYDLASIAYDVGRLTALSSDGDTLFYLDGMPKNGSPSLYYRSISDPVKEPVKLDSDVQTFFISEDGNLITYLKGEDNTLYQHNLTDREKLSSNIVRCKVSADGETVLYLTAEGFLCRKESGKDNRRIDTEVDKVIYTSEDLTDVLYLKGDTVYKNEGGNTFSLLAGVGSILQAYEGDKFYFVTSITTDYPLSHFVEDDMHDMDVVLSEPLYPTRPSRSEFATSDEYRQAFEQYKNDMDAYESGMSAYAEKQKRDALRETLAQTVLPHTAHTLWFFDGKLTHVTDDFVLGELYPDYTLSEKTPLIFYSVYNRDPFQKSYLSELGDIDSLKQQAQAYLTGNLQTRYAAEGIQEDFDYGDATRFTFSEDGKTIYFIARIDPETDYGTLYTASLQGTCIHSPERYDTDVYANFFKLTADKPVYMKNYDQKTGGDLYLDRAYIDSAVSRPYVDYLPSEKTVVYVNDWDGESARGTLKLHANGRITKIADDVSQYVTAPNGAVLYLRDYSNTACKGTLYVYQNGESQKRDDDVVLLLKGNTFENRNKLAQANQW